MNASQPDLNRSEEPLSSWKEIGAYLQRNAATVRRWEKEEGLPIHRHSHKSRSSVYAYASEIDAWRASRKVIAEAAPAPVNTFWRVPTFALAILLCLIMVGNGVRPQAASAKDGPLAKRLVCSDCGASDADISRDGRWMVFQKDIESDLWLRDMSNGKSRLLQAFPGHELGESPAISPDHRQVVYAWSSGGKDIHYQLRILSTEPGSTSRVLLDSPQDDFYEAAWLPDGKSLLVLISKVDKTVQFARVSVADGAVTAVKQFTGNFGYPQPSPDGKYIAYTRRTAQPVVAQPGKASTGPANYVRSENIYLLAADGSNESKIVKAAGINQNPVWTADGKHILFTSDRSGRFDLWSIAVHDGKAAGPESLVSADTGNIRIIGAAGGSYYYYAPPRQAEFVHLVRATSSGSPEDQRFVGIRPAWSPDGKSIAFKRHHPGGAATDYDLVIRSLESGEEKTPLAGLGLTGGGAPIWFHDSASVMTGVRRNGQPLALYRINVKTGEIVQPKQPPGANALSADDRTLYIGRRASGATPAQVAAFDLNTGQERVVVPSISDAPILLGPALALSPDGRTLAIGWLNGGEGTEAKLHIARVSVDGSGFREVFARPVFGGGIVAWDRDGRSILFNQEQPEGASHWGVMRVPAEGSAQASLVMSTAPIQGFDVSPDGSRIAYSANDRVVELWALDNVLPALK